MRQHVTESQRQSLMVGLVSCVIPSHIAAIFNVPLTGAPLFNLAGPCGLVQVDIKALRRSRDLAGAVN